MSRPLFLRLLIAISLASIVGFVLLFRIWHASAQFEEKLSSLRSRSDVTELLGTPDYTFNSNTEMIDEMEGAVSCSNGFQQGQKRLTFVNYLR